MIATVAGAGVVVAGCSPPVARITHPPVIATPARVGNAVGPRGRIVMASWYGPRFEGRRTKSGEIFHQNRLTAASRTLPIGSHVRVTDLATHKSVVVRINDRGPYARGRGIDLSRRAARIIGITHHDGVARVRVQRLDVARATISRSISP